MYGGMCQAEYFKSCLSLTQALNGIGFSHDFLITTNESLIQRARNTSVARFLETDFSHLMFIDGDIEFSVEDVQRVWNLEGDISVGLYPMKRVDEPLSAWVGGKLIRDLPDSPFEVDYAGTGFMLIKREVFEDFQEQFPERAHQEGHVGDCFNWFDTRVEDGIFLSEDYCFCRDARSLGYKIIADPLIKLTHWGRYGYGG